MVINKSSSFIRREAVLLLACIVTIIGLSLFVDEKTYAASDKTPLGAHMIELNKEVTGETYFGDGDYRYYKFTTLNTNGVTYKIKLINTGDYDLGAHIEDYNLNEVEYDYLDGDNNYFSYTGIGSEAGKWSNTVYSLAKSRTYYLAIRCSEYKEKSTFNFTVKAIIEKPTKVIIKKVKPGKKSIKVSFYKSNYATKYQVAIKKHGGKWKTYNNGTKRSRKFTGLKRGKKYTVKVRAIRVYNGKEYKGKWSNKKTVKVK